MKNGFFKKFAAVATAATMALGMATAASASASSGQITGDVEAVEVVYEIEIPTDLTFKVDAYSVATDAQIAGNQAYMPTVELENYTKQAAVRLTYDIKLNLGDNVKLVAQNAVIPADKNTDDLNMYVGVAGATDITASPGEIKEVSFASFAEEEAFAALTVGEVATVGEVSVTFVMDKFAGSNNTTDFQDVNAAAFTLYAEINTDADWKTAAEEMSVKGSWTLKPVSEENYDLYSEEFVGFSMLPAEAQSNEPTFGFLTTAADLGTRDSETEMHIAFLNANADGSASGKLPAGNVEIPFAFDGYTVKEAHYTDYPTIVLTPSVQANVNTGILTLVRETPNQQFHTIGSGGEFGVTITFQKANEADKTVEIFIDCRP